MNHARLLIPTTAAIALSSGGLSGCGDGEPSAEEVFRAACEKYQRCSPEEFDRDYDGIDDCVDTYTGYLEEYRGRFIEEYGKECFDSYIDYYLCYWEAYAELQSCGEDLDDTDICLREYAAIEANCDFGYYEGLNLFDR